MQFAKAGCSGTGQLRESCENLALAELGSYQASMTAAFLEDSECHGIDLIESSLDYGDISQQESTANWNLDVNRFTSPSQAESSYIWNLDDISKPSRMISGPSDGKVSASPKATIHSVCRILSGTGGTWLKTKLGSASFDNFAANTSIFRNWLSNSFMYDFTSSSSARLAYSQSLPRVLSCLRARRRVLPRHA